jgi:ABC-type taurine transport system substrate-binding protein
MTANAKKNAAAKAKAEALAAKRAKDLLAAQQKTNKLAQDQALLKKQSALFDLQQIELVAALQGKLSDDERKRVELQLALLQGNEAAAAKLSTEIANSIDKTGNLAKYLQTLPDAANPFKNWSTYLDAIEAQAARIAAMGGSKTSDVPPATNSFAFPDLQKYILSPELQSGINNAQSSVPPIVVTIDGKAIATALQDQSLSGNNTAVTRTTGNFSAI